MEDWEMKPRNIIEWSLLIPDISDKNNQLKVKTTSSCVDKAEAFFRTNRTNTQRIKRVKPKYFSSFYIAFKTLFKTSLFYICSIFTKFIAFRARGSLYVP